MLSLSHSFNVLWQERSGSHTPVPMQCRAGFETVLVYYVWQKYKKKNSVARTGVVTLIQYLQDLLH